MSIKGQRKLAKQTDALKPILAHTYTYDCPVCDGPCIPVEGVSNLSAYRERRGLRATPMQRNVQ